MDKDEESDVESEESEIILILRTHKNKLVGVLVSVILGWVAYLQSKSS